MASRDRVTSSVAMDVHSLSGGDKEKVLSGMCPWCERGPFVVIASHVSKSHGVDIVSFRDMLGITKNYSITDPGYHAHMSEQTRERWRGGMQMAKLSIGVPKRRSVALVKAQHHRKVIVEKECPLCGSSYMETSKKRGNKTCGSDECIRMSQSLTVAADYRCGVRRSPTQRLTGVQVIEIRTLYSSGEFSQSALAERYGVSQAIVSMIVLGKSHASTGGPISPKLTLPEAAKRPRKRNAT